MTPLYESTLGAAEAVPFAEAMTNGLAPDGGLYVPTFVPDVVPEVWGSARPFPERATSVLGTWLADELERPRLKAIVHDALNFPVPLIPLAGEGWEGISVMELFHGPTLSFKDFGARTMARLMAHFAAGRDERVTILVATSGDTGSAVADGFAGLPNVRVRLLYPKGQVSPVQERQLIVRRDGVRSYAVDGTFDDCQRLVKQAFADTGLSGLRISSANSINVGRLLPQMLYYLHAAAQAADETVFCVPSGNLGNLTGGVLARLSGMPVRRFIAAHNANDAFPRLLQDGARAFGPSTRTLSNAMDVGAPSNYERLEHLLDADTMRRWIWATSVDDGTTLATIRSVYEATGYLADPHTAVGLEAARRYRQQVDDAGPVVVLSTAHPAKFPEVVEHAVGFTPSPPERLRRLWEMDTQVEELPPTIEALRQRLLHQA